MEAIGDFGPLSTPRILDASGAVVVEADESGLGLRFGSEEAMTYILNAPAVLQCLCDATKLLGTVGCEDLHPEECDDMWRKCCGFVGTLRKADTNQNKE
jgi:hypothetical protein